MWRVRARTAASQLITLLTSLLFDIMHIMRITDNSAGSQAGHFPDPATQRRGVSVGGVMPIET